MTRQGITDKHLTRGKLTNNMNLASSHIHFFPLTELVDITTTKYIKLYSNAFTTE